MSRTRFEASLAKRAAVNRGEADGIIADSTEIRLQLMKRVHAGEITLAEAQAQLKKIKSAAKKNGMLTRAQAFSRG